ncbi:MAG: hypothetical protein K2N95_14550 [Lachnospiraceae bacterium]|nr:hypothetical protein [Lachnospiraceae bacterium]
MRLYKMELYKICSKKLFIFSVLASLAILLLFFWSFVIGAESTVNGVTYTGYQAVQMDREITQEFKGALTDQKVAQIIEKYGFPYGVSEDYNVFLYRNYLNNFVMHGFSDGYYHDWEDYHVGTCTYPIAGTDMGKAGAATGKTLLLEYSYGWQVFTEVLQIGCVLGMALIVLTLAPVFSEESYINTRQILFTTKEGKTGDVIARIAAGMTIAIGVYAVVVILDFVLVWGVFGLDGLNCFYSQVMDEIKWISDWNNYHNASTDYMRDFIGYYVFACFLGMTETGAASLYFSAHCKSSFQSVIATAMSLLVPLLLFMLSDIRGVFFYMCNMFVLILPGIALMCFVSGIANKVFSFIVKTVCCMFPVVVGYLLRRRFMFYTALPVWLIMRNMYSNMGIWRSLYPWMQPAVFCFAAALSVIFIVCSWKKYRFLYSS